MFKIGVFAIIVDNQKRVLLGHRCDYNVWDLPGGGMESGETPWDCAVREVKEETGLDVQVTRLLGVYSRQGRDEVAFQFECTILGGELTTNSEADDLQYFALDSLPKNISPNKLARIKDYFENQNFPFLKVLTGKSTKQLIEEGLL
ncbi:MAG: NUDIX hydrolase [Parcubacteria group bacterium GW2011_GWC2_39_14]|nr:MAG: NUDIX hydrolase [Parcubacteria group bacterium GW2011_GWC2_39_14]KKR55433.1 MAG: NUDIX hydrolase [Parcubacteria group bacterium GW2011_GWA2_40_23]